MAAGLPPACILAGGLRIRLGNAVREIAKPLLPVAGEPFLIHDRLELVVGMEDALAQEQESKHRDEEGVDDIPPYALGLRVLMA
jgi:hypothetical protein